MLGYKSLSEDNTIVTPSAKGVLERTLKAAIHSLYIEALKHKPDQGKAFELTTASRSMEKTPRAWQLCHNAIQSCLVKAIAPRLGEVTVNCTIPGTDSPLRPDGVVTDEAQKKIILVDITVPFENRTPAFREARARKLEK
ncbi:hypothetical protein UY3_10721 [Chelonia mydas]|uniref:Uncharacterized protein n=1 Tax=Chelonia mydas TaxID=8469 RepID=M7B2M4_CHEMY|nr:hypothetical protein UY3_10721 [Chelonia mydas]